MPGWSDGDEAVHVHALTAVQDVDQALDLHERVADRVRCDQERVAADVELHRRVQGEHDHLAGGVPGEGDAPGAVGRGDHERHPAEHPLQARRRC